MHTNSKLCDNSLTDDSVIIEDSSYLSSEIDDIDASDASFCMNTSIQNRTKDESTSNLNVSSIWQKSLFVVITMLAILVYVQHYKENDSLIKKCTELRTMSLDYPNQDIIFWKSLEMGVDNILNNKPTKPSTFFFVYEKNKHFNKFIKKITEVIHKCLDNNKPPTIISGNELEKINENDDAINDYGIMISKYETLLKNSGFMIVNDLNSIPVNMVPSFHVFCDTENPLVYDAIIIFTMKLNNKNLTMNNYNYVVDDYLREIWGKSINNNLLEPLITRLTDQVLYLM